MLQKIILFLNRFKVFHILFWLFLWYSETAGVSVHNGRHNAYVSNLIGTLPALFFCACCVYLVLGVFKPKFFEKRKYGAFILLSFLAILVLNLFSFLIQGPVWSLLESKTVELNFGIIYLSNTIESIVLVVIFFAMSVVTGYFNQRMRNDKLEVEKIRAELNFLHAQINPHFLFNAINSIFVLIDDDKEEARKCLHIFSEMLRYQLYDCRNETIELEREVEFIQNYLSIEKIRKSDQTTIETVFEIENPETPIIPLLLITFVENACKYVGKNVHGENHIIIQIRESNFQLSLSCANTIGEETGNKNPMKEGIGIHNSKRRLELVYPDKHHLELIRKESYFDVQLNINLQA